MDGGGIKMKYWLLKDGSSVEGSPDSIERTDADEITKDEYDTFISEHERNIVPIQDKTIQDTIREEVQKMKDEGIIQ
ncbi:hypothetical protein KAR91_77875 [Candidatus Pacearchaeota archaeon]|nr:hypothetical protein [Candidatus Pacearchaeota archaeon]